LGTNSAFALRTEESHGKPWSSWAVAGPFGCIVTSILQSGN